VPLGAGNAGEPVELSVGHLVDRPAALRQEGPSERRPYRAHHPREFAMSDAKKTIQDTVEQNRVVLFMKGTKNFPQCGFSQRAVEILKKCGAEFKDVNVLSDPEIRQGIKDYSSWPTIPQIYIGGKFVGGSDILNEMFQSGELQKLLTP
jgi:monothiol glutaredoxin